MSVPFVKVIFLTHVATTLIMVGVIWFVQVVHYPLFGRVGQTSFAAYEADHSRLTTWVVAPPMLIELITAVLLLWQRPEGLSEKQLWVGLGLLTIIWVSTAFLQVPRHNVLALGFDRDTHRALVTSNWIRTLAWSLRGVLVLYMLSGVLK